MWLVWPKTAQLYLSRSLILLKPVQGDVRVLPAASALPLDQLLNEVQAGIGKGERVQIHVSAGYCSALAIRYPAGAVNFSDRITFAHSVGASHLGLTPEEVKCEIDALHPTLAAFIPLALWTGLQQWAKEHSIKLISVRPLWSIAMQSRLVRSQDKVGLVLCEPDSLSAFKVEEESGAFQALSVPLQEDAPEYVATQLQEVLQFLELKSAQTLQLRFGPAGMPKLPDGPRVWKSYWQLL